MSVVLQYTPASVDLAQLHDELLRAAALAVAPGDVPERVELVDVVTDAGLETETHTDTVFLTMPDAVDEPAIDAVVAAHVPQARYDLATRRGEVAAVSAAQRRRALLRGTREAVRGAADLASLRAATLRVVDLVEEVG